MKKKMTEELATIKNPGQIELGKITTKEIWEIPDAIRRCIGHKRNRDKIREIATKMNESGIVSIYILGSGTSYHAGSVSMYWFSQLAKIPTHCELAPEFPYLIEPIIAKKHAVICISQSGESDLTVYAAQKSKDAGAFVVSITNEEDSALAKIAGDHTLLTRAGKEESVLATKTYATQLVMCTALAMDFAHIRGEITDEVYENLWDELKAMPKLIELVLPNYRKEIRKIAPYFKFAKEAFIIGAGPYYANCMESALKLKEGAQIFAQAYSTAEYVHGPVTLASPYTFVLCEISPPDTTQRHEDVVKLIKRLKARGVTILGIKNPKDIVEQLDISIDIPQCNEVFAPIFSIIPVQLLVVEIATIKNINCDTPKYLTKVSKL